MSSLITDFNVSPYFDDYDEDKRYSRILYRPAVAVQARELTQSQTILQAQIQRFGDHIFKDGSIVDGVGIVYYANVHYLSLADTLNTNPNNFISSLANNNYLVTNMNETQSSNAVRGVIKLAIDGNKAAAPYTNRLYIDYISTGTNSSTNASINEFQPGDTLYFYSSSQSKLGTLSSNNLVDSISTLTSNGSFTSNGYAYCVGVSDGTIYQKGFFSKVPTQVIAVGNTLTTNVNGYVVGFDTVESIVTENQDTSLNDNALGYDNENAPGAHRLKLTPTLVSKTIADTANNKNFFAITQFDQNQPTQQKSDPQYAALQRALAERTYDESGDYVIRPFKLDTLPSANGNANTFDYQLSSGTAYIRGNRIDKLNSILIGTDRAITTNTIPNQILTANYGNYVICKEYVGTFDEELLQSVTLYDTRQTSISDIEGNIAGPAGTAIGTANIRAVVYYNGEKGTSEAQYYVYLFNIQMSAGKSFSSVQSIYGVTGSFGIARADIVLDNDMAVLKNASGSSLVFNTGIPAVKSISNSSFIFIEINSGTLQTTGNVSITIEPTSPGGTETLKESIGTYSTAAILADYNIFSSTNVIGTNLSGTLAINSGNGTVNGTSTSFNTDFKVGSLIRYSNATSTDVKAKVVSITNSTSMVINPVPNSTNGTITAYQKYFISGTPLPITSVQVVATNQFIANTGLALSASSTVYASYPVYKTSATSIGKVINKSTLIKINCSNNVATSVGPWDLGLVDVLKIKNVYVGTTFTGLEVAGNAKTDWFTIDNGQTDETYDHAKLYVKPAYASQISASTVMTVELDHFTANTAAGVGFFSIGSYPVDDANTANTNAIQTADIPIYGNVDLRSAIDIRARKYNTASITQANSAATVNPLPSNNSFDVYSNGQHTVMPDTNFQASFNYYLPRQDLITINSNGDASVQKGIPAVKPILPIVENDQSIVAEVYVPGYPSLTQREAETYKSFNNAIKINLKSNRRYTMKDIGALEERIKRIEYYTVLNALEQGAKDLSIPDANGLNRFKNGIFADPFNSHNNGNIKDIEYKIAVDPEATVMRPSFITTPVDYKYVSASSSNVAQLGSYLMLAYTDDLFVKQQYATKYRVCCESVWSWNGLLTLYPSIDAFKDTTAAPAQNINIDLTSAARDFAAGPQGKIYGEARTTKNTKKTYIDAHHDLYTTTSTQSQTVTNMVVDVSTTNVDLGSKIVDVSINPYMRSRKVGFIARNMKPNTVVHAFFDSVNIDQYCAPGLLSPVAIQTLVQGREDAIVTQNGAFGAALVANSSGGIAGVFNIPAQKFRTGDRLFQLTNVSDLTTGGSAITTSSKATYSASGISLTKQSTTLALEEPVVKYETGVQVTTAVTQVIKHHPDPIAQSFTIDGLPSNVTGIMLSKVGVYFQSKDATLGVSLLLCEMTNNQPDSSKIIGRSYLKSSDVTANATLPTVETVFTLDYPVFLLNNTDYAFIVEPDGNSPDYTVWVGETGGTDVNTGTQVFSNPYSGILFVSANEKTWTAIQKEDMMFNLYRAKFTKRSGTAVFTNDDDEYVTYSNRTYQNSKNTIDIGDVAYTINTTSGAFNTANTILGSPFGRVYYVNDANNQVYIDSSNGGFSNSTGTWSNAQIGFFRVPDTSTNTSIGGLVNTAQINATSIVAIATISSLGNLTYHAIQNDFGSLQPAKTSLSYGYKGVVGSTQDSTYTIVPNGREYEFLDAPRAIKSKSNEAGTKSATFSIQLDSETDYSSPVINLKRKSAHIIENIINNDATNEQSKYGNSQVRYISKTVTLADGQDAEDLKVYLTAYRPLNTDIKVYGKFLNAQDPETFDSKFWTLLNYANNTDLTYSSTTDIENFIEYEFSVPNTSSYASITGTLATGCTFITSISSNSGIFVGQTLTSNVTSGITTNTAVASVNATHIVMTAVAGASGPALINAAPSTAFGNSSSLTSVPLTGTVVITNNSVTLTGTGTTFLTSFTPGSTIKIAANNSYYAYRKIVSITSDTSMTVDLGLPASNSASIFYTYSTGGNGGTLEYQNSTGSRFIGYKQFALKIVLLSNNAVQVPRLQDVRAIALQI